MSKQRAAAERRYQAFLATVGATGVVWGLRGGDGWAAAPGNEPAAGEDGDEAPRMCLAFWSTRAGAAACAHAEWTGYVPAEIGVREFLEVWLAGMVEDGMLAGVEWDAQWNGVEIEPDELEAALASAVVTPGAGAKPATGPAPAKSAGAPRRGGGPRAATSKGRGGAGGRGGRGRGGGRA